MLLLTLAVVEGSLRLMLSTNRGLALLGSHLDEPSWRLLWIQGQSKPKPFTQPFDRHHPTRGWALAPGLDTTVFGSSRLTSNSLGIRGAGEIDVPKPRGRLRILVFGDSFSFGEEVADDEAYPQIAERALAAYHGDIEVLNLGVHGYAHDQMLLYLREVGEQLEPDVVVLGYVAQDAERNLHAFRDFAKPRFRLTSSGLQLEATPVPDPDELRRAHARSSRLVDVASMLAERTRWRIQDRQEHVWALTAAILDAFVAEVERIGAHPLLVQLPVLTELTSDADTTAPERFLAGVCREQDADCLFLRPAFREYARREGATFETERHWTPLEHGIAGETLAARLHEHLGGSKSPF